MSSEKGFDKTAAEVKRIKAQLQRREEENVGLSKKMEQLESEYDDLERENRDLKEVINRAKNISPWARPNFTNVRRMAARWGINIVKAPGGWVVKMASKIGKKFKRLRDIWLILTQEEFFHEDFFPYEEVAPASAPASASAPAPAPVSALSGNHTRVEHNQIEVLRAEWRLFPSMREAIEEKMAQYGIVPTPT